MGALEALNVLRTRLRWYRARRTWTKLAGSAPKEVTASYDASDSDTYWSSGKRDMDVVLGAARAGGLATYGLAVEIGCGIGRITRCLADLFSQVVGVDISPGMLAIASAEAARPNVKYESIGPDWTLPLQDNVADLVMAWTVFRHVPEGVFASYLREAHRVLRSGGIFAFEAQNREVGPIERSDGHLPYPEREYRRSELLDHCANAGFIWGAEVERPSATAGTITLVVAMRKP